jgi:hypothetical protein
MEVSMFVFTLVASVGLGLGGAYVALSSLLFVMQRAVLRAEG